ETYSSKSVEEIWKAEWGGKIYYSHGTTHSKDKMGGATVQKKQKVIDEIEGLTRRFKLHDIWRNQHTNKTQFTWRNNSLKVQCRLDYWLVSKEL
ncbi:unnamed protein product, partial [Porites evermanni]